MKTSPIIAAALGIVLGSTASPAAACPPPPPGWVAPTPAQQRANGVREAVDIVYGRIETQRFGAPVLRIYHVYKGARPVGSTLAVTGTYNFPVPVCAGMMVSPPPGPVGTTGVFLTRSYSAEPVLIPPAQVQSMIAEGLIRSARLR